MKRPDTPETCHSQGSPVSDVTDLALHQLAGEIGVAAVIELANDFMEDLDAILGHIEQALDDSNLIEVERHAHTLKATASIFDLTDLAMTAAFIEEQCHSGQMKGAQDSKPKLSTEVAKAAEQLRASIATLMKQNHNE